jgi:hypothetical protein
MVPDFPRNIYALCERDQVKLIASLNSHVSRRKKVQLIVKGVCKPLHRANKWIEQQIIDCPRNPG